MNRDKDITIIGAGGMGGTFAKFFRDHSFDVLLYDSDKSKLKQKARELEVRYESNMENSVKNADLVMISVPIPITSKMIRNIAPSLKKNALLFDITSLKSEVYEEMQKVVQNYPVNCLSLHPMFGPGISKFENYVMIFLKVGGTRNYNSKVEGLISLFQNAGLKITELKTPEEHDKMMALTLGIPHMLNIVFLNLLKRADKSLDKLNNFTGTTFLLQKVFAESIIQREMKMFGEIQIGNKEFHKILDIFEEIIHDYKKAIRNENYSKFYKYFENGLEYSKKDKHFKDSYKYFYEFMKILKKE
jgi:prephenate dehydrogenase